MFDSEEEFDPGVSSDVFHIAVTALAWAEDETVVDFDNHELTPQLRTAAPSR